MELPHITEQNELHVSNSEVALDRIQNKKICPFLWWGAFWDRVSLNTLGTLCCNSRYRPSLPKTRVSSPASWLLGFKVCAITEQLGNILFSRHRKLTASNMCIQEYSVCVCVCVSSFTRTHEYSVSAASKGHVNTRTQYIFPVPASPPSSLIPPLIFPPYWPTKSLIC